MASKVAWIPADDLLLKNAVEDGASLEALAKGAVRFSRRFTFKELQDRWHSLLYDPHISAEASARMVEFERSSSNNAPKLSRFGNFKANIEVSGKRKVESIRRMYYSMRKRIRSQPFNANGIASLSSYPPKLNICTGNEDAGDYVGHMLVKSEDPIGTLHGDHIISSMKCCEIAGEVMRPCGASTVAGISLTNNLKVKNSSNAEFMYDDSVNVCLGYEKQFNSPNSDRDSQLHSAGISDCLVNIVNEVPLLIIDEDANTAIDTDDNLNSLLLSSPNQSHEEGLPDDCEPNNKVEGEVVCPEITEDASQTMLEVTESLPQTAHDSLHSDVNMPSSSSVPKSPFPEIHNDVLVCLLNTEDPEVPSNDDIFPLGVFTIAAAPLNLGMINEPTSHFQNQDDGDHECLEGKNPGQSCINSQRVKSFKRLCGTGPYDPLAGHGKAKLSDATYPDAPCRHAKGAYLELGPSKSCICTLGPVKGEQQGSDSLAIVGESPPFHEDSELMGVAFPEAALKPTTSENEAYESDEDMPCFSDVEALILEMDLCAYDQQLVSTAVSNYQHDNVKKSIIKLEQCARSSQQRGLTSQGALAIFYGRRLKYYIRKTQVILGRATEDTDVDIDLGKEGRANKISRRQAIIKMDKDGSFVLRNVGKVLVSVNGKEIMKGQLLRLGSSCLIEIREMRFVFEVNHKFVRQYLLNAAGKPKNATFDWVAEGLP